MNFNETTLTDAVLARMAESADPRFTQVMSSLVTHLHAFIRDVEITEAEWQAAIAFLTATGQKCDDKRQEFILLSDTLGVSMLVDAINHRTPDRATESTVFGPFFVEGAPDCEPWGNIAGQAQGTPCFMSGTVSDLSGRPLAGAMVDVWQSDGKDGHYDVQVPDGPMQCRARLRTDALGRFSFRTVQPVSYPVPTDGPVGTMLNRMGRHPFRPAHIHTMITHPGHPPLVTHVFVAGDRYLDSDAVFGVKDSLVVPFILQPAGKAPDGSQMSVPFSTVHYDFVLAAA